MPESADWRSHRLVRPVARGLVLVLVVLGTTAFAFGQKTVTLDVDGSTRTVTAFGGTVSDVLRAHGVPVGDRDLVVPAADAPLVDGDTVVVRHGRELTVVVDGHEQQVWSTAATVDDVVADLGLRGEIVTSADRSARPGTEPLEIATVKTVHVAVDGATTTLTTAAPSVREALVEAGVVLGEHDQVSVPLDAALVDGLAVVVTRVATEVRTETSEQPFEVVREEDDDLLKGTEVVAVRGREGRSVVTYEAQLVDGVEVGRTVLLEAVLEPTVDQVVRVGTADAPTGTVDLGDGVWAALARCESGGNPSIVSSNGLYHGLYQFSVATWRSVGGSGLPSQASPEEQTKRAKMLQARSGWGQWPACSRKLGLR